MIAEDIELNNINKLLRQERKVKREYQEEYKTTTEDIIHTNNVLLEYITHSL